MSLLKICAIANVVLIVVNLCLMVYFKANGKSFYWKWALIIDIVVIHCSILLLIIPQ